MRDIRAASHKGHIERHREEETQTTFLRGPRLLFPFPFFFLFFLRSFLSFSQSPFLLGSRFLLEESRWNPARNDGNERRGRDKTEGQKRRVRLFELAEIREPALSLWFAKAFPGLLFAAVLLLLSLILPSVASCPIERFLNGTEREGTFGKKCASKDLSSNRKIVSSSSFFLKRYRDKTKTKK